MGISTFIRAAEAAVLQLTDSAPFITAELMLSCLLELVKGVLARLLAYIVLSLTLY
jgi:hypothetical protein